VPTLKKVEVGLILSYALRTRAPPLNWNLGSGIIRLRNSFARFTDSALEVDQSTKMADMVQSDINNEAKGGYV
jgi:hypothetical protein